MARFRRRELPPSQQYSSLATRAYDPYAPGGGKWSNWHEHLKGSQTFPAFEEMTDQVNPGYFRAEREGTLKPVSPMSRLKQQDIVVPGGGEMEIAPVRSPFKTQLRVDGYFYPNGSELPRPTNMAEPPSMLSLQRALARAQTDAWDALTFAAEFRSTLETVIGLRSRCLRLFDRLISTVASRAKRTSKGVDIAKLVSEVWLELRYAWRPLIYDIEDINEAIQRLQAGVETPLRRAYDTEKAHSEKSSSTASTTITVGAAGSLGYAGYAIRQDSTSSVEISLHSSVGVWVTTRVATMADPLVTAWELIPYSFVLDWFISVGDMLAAFSPFATGHLAYATLGVKTTQIERSSNTIIPQAGYVVYKNSMIACSRTRTTTSYVRRIANPKPTLGVQIDLSTFKVLDLVALWLSQNSSITKRLLRHF